MNNGVTIIAAVIFEFIVKKSNLCISINDLF